MSGPPPSGGLSSETRTNGWSDGNAGGSGCPRGGAGWDGEGVVAAGAGAGAVGGGGFGAAAGGAEPLPVNWARRLAVKVAAAGRL